MGPLYPRPSPAPRHAPLLLSHCRQARRRWVANPHLLDYYGCITNLAEEMEGEAEDDPEEVPMCLYFPTWDR